MVLTETLQQIGMVLGGIGLFLLAVRMITEGLTLAAGEALRDILARSTQSLSRGIVSGMGITAVVQSSSAVTVATIGFVNAGLLNLSQALGIIYGSNIGTTMTGWLVAALGFKIKVEAFALPMIGLGMLLRLTGSTQRRGAIGEAMAGFGLFFIGIDVLKTAFEGVAPSINLHVQAPEGVAAILVYVGLGFLMTMLMQSSSAAIAIILTAAAGGVLPLASAAAMVIGANVGTTSTAALAVIGATPNAKRVASAHIVFNILAGTVALALLPMMLWLVQVVGRSLQMEEHPAVTLALFHTIFNVLGVLLMWPTTRVVTRFLDRRFVSHEELAGRPQFLDKTVAVSPVLALHALALEVGRLGGMARELAADAMRWESRNTAKVAGGAMAVEKLNLAVGDFVSRLERSSLPSEVTARLPQLLRAAHYYATVAEIAKQFSSKSTIIEHLQDRMLASGMETYRQTVRDLLVAMDPQSPEFDSSQCDEMVIELSAAYQHAKNEILEAGTIARIHIPGMSSLLEEISRLRRIGEQIVKGSRDLAEVLSDPALAVEGQSDEQDDESTQKDEHRPVLSSPGDGGKVNAVLGSKFDTGSWADKNMS